MRGIKYIIGVDEAGRGPLAGPVAVGAVLIPVDFDMRDLNYITDSKKMTSKRRGNALEDLIKKKKNSDLQYAFSSVSAGVIDSIGIVRAIDRAIHRSLCRFDIDPQKTSIFLDGSLRAPKRFINQKTIIKGDEKIKIISLASIVAKVERDKKMIRLSNKFPEYGFGQHKGYGTKMHYEKIREYGLCDIHRRSFLKRLILN